MKDKVHIALVANERYRPRLECTKASMLRACATPDRLVFHGFGDKDMEPFLAQMESLELGVPVITTDGAKYWKAKLGVTYLDGYLIASHEQRVQMLRDSIRKFQD